MNQTLDGQEGNESCEEINPLNEGCLFDWDSDFEIPETPSPTFSKQNSQPYQAAAAVQDRSIAYDGRKPRSAVKSATHSSKKCLVMNTAILTPRCSKQLFVEETPSSCLRQKTPVHLKQKQNLSSPRSVSGTKSTSLNTASKSTKIDPAYKELLNELRKKYPARKPTPSPKPRVSTIFPVQGNRINKNCRLSLTVPSSSQSPAMKRARSTSSASLTTASNSKSQSPAAHGTNNTHSKENECLHSVRTSFGFLSPLHSSVSASLRLTETSSSATLTHGISDWIDLVEESSEIVASSDRWEWNSPIVIDDDPTDNYVRVAQLEEDEALARRLQAQYDLEVQSPECRSPFHAMRENAFPEFCGLPGCGEYDSDLWATADIGYCGRPGCREYQRHRNDMLPSNVMNPVLQDLERFFDDPNGRSRARRHSRNHTAPFYLHGDAIDGNDYEALLDFEERQGSAVAQGKLSNSDINRLPIKTFDPEHAAGKTQCHICFNDYSSGEKLRMLPCLHDYHCQCIDRWLKDHSNCPICRVDINLESA